MASGCDAFEGDELGSDDDDAVSDLPISQMDGSE